MYALSDSLRDAWQALHKNLAPELEKIYGLQMEPLRFRTDSTTLSDPNLLIGQTCGYPLVTQLSGFLTPLCVPHFDVAGCEEAKYSSAIIVSARSAFQSLADYRGSTAVINSQDSNSGMNMFRAELAPLREANSSFFSQTLVSGSHLESIQIVAKGIADVAAIDCVTFALIADTYPRLISKIKILAYTQQSMGLPFVMPNYRAKTTDSTSMTNLFNSALKAISSNYRKRLHIRKFSDVSINDYQTILDIDKLAHRQRHSALHL